MTDPKNDVDRAAALTNVDAEWLAALLDGRLDKRRRAELLEQLAGSEDAFAAYLDAVAITGELEAAPKPGETSPLESIARRRWWQRPGTGWLALAAIFVGVTLVPWTWTRLSAPDDADPARFVELLEAEGSGLPRRWDGRPWGVTRAAADPLTPAARAVRLGARQVDLELAVRTRDPRTSELAEEIVVLLRGLQLSAPIATMYREVARRAGEPQERLEPLLRQARVAAAKRMGESFVDLGAWTEAGRIAASSRDAGYFRERTSRNVLDRAAADVRLGEPARSAVERARTAMGAGDPPDWNALEYALTELLRVLGS